MFPSLVLVPAFTAVFAVTGLRALARLVVPVPAAAGGDRMAELSHLLMSVAMLGMTWGWPGGPDTAAGVAQFVVFGLLAVLFVVRVLDPAEQQRVDAPHVLALLAMLWMVGMSAGPASVPASSGHHGHGPTGGTAGAAPAWMQVVTVAFVMLLCATAVARVARVPRRPPLLVPAAAPQDGGSGTRPRPPTGRRLDVAGHVLMSGGMAAMLLAML
jgi:uncharacterized membrane protein YtjA (UPF0391 family)